MKKYDRFRAGISLLWSDRTFGGAYSDEAEEAPDNYEEISFVCLRADGSLELPSGNKNCFYDYLIGENRGNKRRKIMPIPFEVGDIVRLKKKHPCGSQEWEVLRVGADFRLKCLGCGRQMMVERKMVEKNTRGIRKREEN